LRRARWPAAAALVVLAGYVGFQYAQKQEATEFGGRYAREHGLRGCERQRAAASGVAVQLDGVRVRRRSPPLRRRQSRQGDAA